MPSVPKYPIFLELVGRPCLVAGAGTVGVAKARGLVECGAEVLLVDPSPAGDAAELAAVSPLVRLERREFREDDCRGRVLVFACTGDEDVDAAVEGASARAGAICCRADGRGRAASGALLRRGDLCVAVSSGGASPALAAEARDRVASVVGEEFGVAGELLSDLRTRLRQDIADSSVRREALAAPLVQSLLEHLGAGRPEDARAAVEHALEAARCAAGVAPGAREPRCIR